MRAIVDIALHELRLIFNDRSIWVNLVLLPIVISIAVGAANGAFQGPNPATPAIRVDVLDLDQTAASQAFSARIAAANTQLTLCPAAGAEPCRLETATLTAQQAETRLADGVTLALVEIPAGFGAALSSGQPAGITYRSDEDATAPGYILQAVQAAAAQTGGAAEAQRLGASVAGQLDYVAALREADRATFDARIGEAAAALWEGVPVRVVQVQATVRGSGTGPVGSGFQQSITGIGSMYVMFAVFGAVSALIRERQQGTFGRILTMPVTRAQIISGKMLGRFVVGMMQYGVMFGFGLALGVRYGSDPLALVLLMTTFVLSITALTLMLTTFIRNEAQASGITLFAALTLAPLGGAWWPLDIVPAWMRTLGHISPIAWVMDGFSSLMYFGGSLGTILPSLAVLLAFTVAFFGVALLRFRGE